MKKIDIFSVSDENKNGEKYTIDNYYTEPFSNINFRNLPKESTRNLFIDIMDKYNDKTNFSILDLDIMDKSPNIWRDFDILNGISFGTYSVFQDDNYDIHEIVAEYTLFLEVVKYINRIEIKIHPRFKVFCDKFGFEYRKNQ